MGMQWLQRSNVDVRDHGIQLLCQRVPVGDVSHMRASGPRRRCLHFLRMRADVEVLQLLGTAEWSVLWMHFKVVVFMRQFHRTADWPVLELHFKANVCMWHFHLQIGRFLQRMYFRLRAAANR